MITIHFYQSLFLGWRYAVCSAMPKIISIALTIWGYRWPSHETSPSTYGPVATPEKSKFCRNCRVLPVGSERWRQCHESPCQLFVYLKNFSMNYDDTIVNWKLNYCLLLAYSWFQLIWRRGLHLAGRFPCLQLAAVQAVFSAVNSPTPCTPKNSFLEN